MQIHLSASAVLAMGALLTASSVVAQSPQTQGYRSTALQRPSYDSFYGDENADAAAAPSLSERKSALELQKQIQAFSKRFEEQQAEKLKRQQQEQQQQQQRAKQVSTPVQRPQSLSSGHTQNAQQDRFLQQQALFQRQQQTRSAEHEQQQQRIFAQKQQLVKQEQERQRRLIQQRLEEAQTQPLYDARSTYPSSLSESRYTSPQPVSRYAGAAGVARAKANYAEEVEDEEEEEDNALSRFISAFPTESLMRSPAVQNMVDRNRDLLGNFGLYDFAKSFAAVAPAAAAGSAIIGTLAAAEAVKGGAATETPASASTPAAAPVTSASEVKTAPAPPAASAAPAVVAAKAPLAGDVASQTTTPAK